MTKRSIAAVVILTLLTCGLYGLYWFIETKDEMVARGADIPTGWLIIIPFANIYWYWKWSEGVERVTRGSLSAGVSFVLVLFTSVVGPAIIQDHFNRIADGRFDLPQLPRARVV